ncbi:isochorismatase family protein [Streptacidiphilus jiangxiensis]|uniref:Nicotinamidase-related amidase n=1 Tax=Streptacidiphilus jiangxiensis TaxID=235985 RepID=A0A1H7UQ47_STRJI|nr:isochorismatase family protein [Streptacidiphilus jiangxiensis]SEL98946.1 Nicotinamidase-related amidase [Streptacidiphilus jiangxiensis]
MTATTLDQNTALIMIDLQKGIVALAAELGADEVLANSDKLATAFRERGLPVVHVNVTGGAPGRTELNRSLGELPADWAELVLPVAEGDVLVTKQTWGAFHRTGLDAALRERGVTQVVITGIATSAGVESTARAAHEHGYNVTVATDAVADRDPVAHDHSVSRVFPKLGETGTTAELLALLG